MARTLPWERISTGTRLPASARGQAHPRTRSGATRRDSNASGSNDDDGDDGHARRKRQKHSGAAGSSATRFRTPSTSPPPAPPPEAYMVDGLDHDDKYRMVEDELLAVAQSFTAHLHAAEYQRLKARAKQQQAAAATGSSGLLLPPARPVTMAPTDRVQKRAALAATRAKQKKALKLLDDKTGKDDSDDDDGHAPWTGTSLQSLMENSPRTARPALVSLASLTGLKQGQKGPTARRKHRPAEGPSPLKAVTSAVSEGETESDDEDDLDGPPPANLPLKETPRSLPSLAHQTLAHKTPAGKKTVVFAPTAKEISPRPANPSQSEDAAEDSSLSDPDGGDLMDKIRKRREHEKAERQRRQQQQRESRRTG